jgi:hypothetical protein
MCVEVPEVTVIFFDLSKLNILEKPLQARLQPQLPTHALSDKAFS